MNTFGSTGLANKQNLTVSQPTGVPPWLQKLGDPRVIRFKKLKKALKKEYTLIERERLPFNVETKRMDEKESEYLQFIMDNQNSRFAKGLMGKKSGWSVKNFIYGFIGSLPFIPIILSLILNLGVGLPDMRELVKHPIGYTKHYVKEVIIETEEKLIGPQEEAHPAILKSSAPEPKLEKPQPEKKKKHR